MIEHRTSNLTQSQYLLWTGQQIHPEAPLYNMVLAFSIQGPIDPFHFERAFQALLDRSDALRSVVVEREGIPRQRVRPPFSHTLEKVDLSATDPQVTSREWIRERSVRRLDLGNRMWDTALLELAPDRHVWYLNQHHLITDGWSTALVYRRVAEFYELSREDRLADAPPLPAYGAYVDFEQAFRRSAPFRKAQEYWRQKQTALIEPVRLYGKGAGKETTRTERVTVDLGPERSRTLREIAAERDVRALTEHMSLFNVFATLLFAYLYRVSGQHRLTIGTPSHNRATTQFRETIGVFIEVLPLGIEITPDDTFQSLLRRVRNESNAFLRYAQPGVSTPDANRSFNVLLNYINASFPGFGELPIHSEWVHSGHGDSRHHLRLQVHDFDAAGRFLLHFDFNAELFDPAEREMAVGHFLRLLDGFLQDRAQPIRRVDILTEGERHRLLVDFNRRSTTDAAGPTVVQQFEEQVARTPEAVAVLCDGQPLTYRALNSQANRLAHYLRGQGVGQGDVVGLCVRRSPEMIVGILGTLKAGGAYLPVDPSCPAERMAFLLDDAQASVLLTQQHRISGLLPHTARVVVLDTASAPFSDEPEENPPQHPDPTDLAYVIYTSGSTGRPKGVMVEHRALAQYASWARRFYLRGEALAFPLFTPLSFDLTVTSIFVPLLAGGRIVIYGEDEGVADLALLRVIEDNAVDILKLTPAHLSLIQHRDLSHSRIRQLILGGEDLRTELAASIRNAFGDVEIYNEYGPTEATVGCIVHRFNPETDTAPSVPIGRPAAEAQAYILDEDLQLVPPGVVGEIVIGGPGLARGYLGHPELTAERFLPNPFRPGERIYRTGDLGRWRPDGTMQYLGRTDQQVKIRGVRIELGEVEAALATHPKIQACVVDVVPRAPREDEIIFCTRCGLPSNYPRVTYDAEGVCNFCLAFDAYAERARRYFRTLEDLRATFEQGRWDRRGEYDCVMLLSGGKDSTYALYQLVGMGLEVLAFTLDNGYISEQAKANIRRVTEALGVEHVFGTTPAMNAIFIDSLKRHSNVCNGCFKTIYTLGMRLAREKGIPFVVTGLSRGQFFETRLTEELFWDDSISANQIDRVILDARKAYHRVDDAVHRMLDTGVFQNDTIFDEVRILDFYRYCDVSLDEMLAFLDEHAPWIRPSDTGRSTNCLINEVGIYMHKQQRGYHNYAFPYSWDVRTGHKDRMAALEELNDDIDPASVQRILDEIGYTEDSVRENHAEDRLAAYYVSPARLDTSELRTYLTRSLPDYMIPAYFVRLEVLPLTPNGKVDRASLPRPDESRPELASAFAAPRTVPEARLAQIWARALRVDEIGIHDNFFDLGGDSITAIQISARATEAGLRLNPNQIFRHQSVAELATAVGAVRPAPVDTAGVAGAVPLTPIQRWFLDQDPPEPHHWNQFGLFELTESIRPELLREALAALLRHHDALRLRYTREGGIWQQFYTETPTEVHLQRLDLSGMTEPQQDREIEEAAAGLQTGLDLSEGPLIRVAWFELGGSRPDRLLIAIHHLVVDGLSWGILLKDLEIAYRQLARNEAVELPPRTTSYKAWAEHLLDYANSEGIRQRSGDWPHTDAAPGRLRVDHLPDAPPTEESASVVSVTLSATETEAFLHDVPSGFRARTEDALLAALAASLAPWADDQPIWVDVEGHGREGLSEGIDVSRTVGWFTAIHPIALCPEQSPMEALNALKSQRQRLPRRTQEYGVLRYLSQNPDAAVEVDPLPRPDLLFNYLGRLDALLASSSLLCPVGPLGLSRSPRTRRRYLLEINAFVDRGNLQVDWGYSTDVFRPETVGGMANDFLEALHALIESARSPGERRPDPADFPLAKLDEQRLSKVSTLLRDADRTGPS